MCLDAIARAEQTMDVGVSPHLLHCQEEEEEESSRKREASLTNILRPVQEIRLCVESCYL
jgi:hypothetical protein